MKSKELLFKFEEKYKFLYEITVRGVPIYTCYRDIVLNMLTEYKNEEPTSYLEENGKIYFRRFIEGLYKIICFRKKKTLIFTSALYRRDKGRNLAAEYLMDTYDDAVVFEWPSKNIKFDRAYFQDRKRVSYCPLEIYLLFYKIYKIFHRKYINEKYIECYDILKRNFNKLDYMCTTDREKCVVEYLLSEIPNTYADTYASQNVFRWLFSRYKSVETAIDFWGSGRENIIPVLPRQVKSVELQHGIITNYHPGYIYPLFVKDMHEKFFERTILVYGEKTKNLLCGNSIFEEKKIKVIGNPRIQIYKKERRNFEGKKNLILFTSQPYEQDGNGNGYYQFIVPFLKQIQRAMVNDDWKGYQLAVKLHPRENNGVLDIYKRELPEAVIMGNDSELFELLSKSFLHFTVSSTTLYEGAEIGVPTLILKYDKHSSSEIYGFSVWEISNPDVVDIYLNKIRDKDEYKKYLSYLQKMTKNYM